MIQNLLQTKTMEYGIIHQWLKISNIRFVLKSILGGENEE